MVVKAGDGNWVVDVSECGEKEHANRVAVVVTLLGLKVDNDFISWEEIDEARKFTTPLVF